MIGNFDKSFNITLQKEGGYVNNRADKGGPTKYGITQQTLSLWRTYPVNVNDVKNLTEAEAREIYQSRYWNTLRCDLLPSGIDFAVFDAGVNSGVYRAAKWLQKALNVTQDGVLGPKTMDALKGYRLMEQGVIQEICAERLKFCLSLDNATEEAFEKGWAQRVLSVLQTATLMNERDNNGT